MRVLLFDIDGTMLNSGGAGQAAMEQTLESEFGVTAKTAGIPVAGRTDRAITSDMMRFHGIADTPTNWNRFIKTYLTHLPEQLASRPGLVLPGVTRLLNQLHVSGTVSLGLLTGNFRLGAELKLSHFQLLHHFQFGGYGDEHHERDDVARVAAAEGQRHLKLSQLDDVWVIGDTPSDVQCARAIGARAVAVGTGFYSVDQLRLTNPDYLFADFSDVEAVLKTLAK